MLERRWNKYGLLERWLLRGLVVVEGLPALPTVVEPSEGNWFVPALGGLVETLRHWQVAVKGLARWILVVKMAPGAPLPAQPWLDSSSYAQGPQPGPEQRQRQSLAHSLQEL